ncbi:MAG: hypothetical protein IT204_20610 [Fimbriimonadaceae bacterium]|nr:hypothetical protein [Fimbriimonadaceae bacterium]
MAKHKGPPFASGAGAKRVGVRAKQVVFGRIRSTRPADGRGSVQAGSDRPDVQLDCGGSLEEQLRQRVADVVALRADRERLLSEIGRLDDRVGELEEALATALTMAAPPRDEVLRARPRPLEERRLSGLLRLP